jgi:hypothetical protein
MRRRVPHLLLDADEVARQQEIQDLPAPVAQGLEPKRPAAQQGVERRIGLALADQCRTCAQMQFAAFKRLHQFNLILAVRQEQGQGAQWTFETRYLRQNEDSLFYTQSEPACLFTWGIALERTIFLRLQVPWMQSVRPWFVGKVLQNFAIIFCGPVATSGIVAVEGKK